jgi:hypothetical protein
MPQFAFITLTILDFETIANIFSDDRFLSRRHSVAIVSIVELIALRWQRMFMMLDEVFRV